MPPMPGNPQNAEAHCQPTLQCLIVHKVVGFRMSSLCSPWWIHRNHCGSQETKTAEVVIVNMQAGWVRGGCATSRMPPPRLSPLECRLDQEEGEGTQRRNLSNKICVSCTANAALYCCYLNLRQCQIKFRYSVLHCTHAIGRCHMSAIVCHTALAIIGPRRLIFPCDGSHSDGLNRFTLGDNEHCSLSSCTATRIYSGCIIMRLDESAMKYKLMRKMVTFTNHHIRGFKNCTPASRWKRLKYAFHPMSPSRSQKKQAGVNS